MSESSALWATDKGGSLLLRMPMPSVLIHTLGCKLNQLESEAFADAFTQAGFSLHETADGAFPSLVVVNTCTVTSKADQKARRIIRKALRDYPDSCVLVTGCYAQLDLMQIRELEEDGAGRLFVLKGGIKGSLLDLPRFLGEADDCGVFCRLVKSWCENGENAFLRKLGKTVACAAEAEGVFQFNPERNSFHTRSFLKIQDGCDKHCTYCRIRLARGNSVSLGAEQVLTRLKTLEKSHAEAVLTGVNISQYRDNAAPNLKSLLAFLLAGTEKIALRLSSLAPETVSEDFASILCHKRLRPHFHLSIQSGSKKILEKMGRDYEAKTIEDAVSLLRSAKGDPFLACDIIAGFPGETEADFEQTVELCKKIDFAWIHAFPYSKRPGTAAFSLPGNIHEAEVTKRVKILTNLANQGRAAYTRRWLGMEVEALVEKGSGRGICRGISENYLKLLVRCNGEKSPPPGTVLRCKLIEEPPPGADYDAIAEPQMIK